MTLTQNLTSLKGPQDTSQFKYIDCICIENWNFNVSGNNPADTQACSQCSDPGLFKSQFTTGEVMTTMASAQREPIMGVWGQCPQHGGPGGRAPGGGQEAKPLGAESLFAFTHLKEAANLTNYVHAQTFDLEFTNQFTTGFV